MSNQRGHEKKESSSKVPWLEDILKNPGSPKEGLYLKSNFFEDGVGTQNILFDRELSGLLGYVRSQKGGFVQGSSRSLLVISLDGLHIETSWL